MPKVKVKVKDLYFRFLAGKTKTEFKVSETACPIGLTPHFLFARQFVTNPKFNKLDAVRLALRRGDIAEAAKHGRVYELTPVAVK